MKPYVFGRIKLPYGQLWLLERPFVRSEMIQSICLDLEPYVIAPFPDHCLTVESAPEPDAPNYHKPLS